MKFRIIAPLIFSAAAVASASPLAFDDTSWQNDVLRALVDTPGLLTKNGVNVSVRIFPFSAKDPQGQQLLADHVKGLQRRSPQSNPLNALIGAALGTISNIGLPVPASEAAEVQFLEAENLAVGAKRKKIRYGPYRLPALSARNNLESRIFQTSGISNTLKFGAKKPCDGAECVVLQFSASLEQADGNAVDNTDGVWFHHAVLLNSGPEVNDLVCAREKPVRVESIFQSGNEKATTEYSVPGGVLKTGYHIRGTDFFILNTELMNMEDKEQWVWLSITFDYVESTHPEYPQYKEGKLVWMNLGESRCGGRAENPFGASNLTLRYQPTKDVFSEHSIPWTAGFEGRIIGMNGHMHDGGTSTEIFKNQELVCNSIPLYGSGSASKMHSKPQVPTVGTTISTSSEHIVSQAGCIFTSPLPMHKGDTLHLRANYDFTRYPGMKNIKGEIDEVMGTVAALVAVV